MRLHAVVSQAIYAHKWLVKFHYVLRLSGKITLCGTLYSTLGRAATPYAEAIVLTTEALVRCHQWPFASLTLPTSYLSTAILPIKDTKAQKYFIRNLTLHLHERLTWYRRLWRAATTCDNTLNNENGKLWGNLNSSVIVNQLCLTSPCSPVWATDSNWFTNIKS